MSDFMIRFFICNIFISAIIVSLLLAKRIFRNHLTSRMQYHLWFVMLGLMAVPFLPLRPAGFPAAGPAMILRIFSWIGGLKGSDKIAAHVTSDPSDALNLSGTSDWMNDFAFSVTRETSAHIGLLLCGIWTIGILAMLVFIARSYRRLRTLESSALPLQSREVLQLYSECLNEMHIRKNISIYSTAFFRSPVIVGVLRPRIYLPIYLISDYDAAAMRYMLLHELQHYRHRDAIANHLMNLINVLYWFNPFVWFALKEMRNDREIACDTSVLNMLGEGACQSYGNTLIDFAEKVSLTSFPFAAGLSGNKKQMKRRIINIASYKKPSFRKKVTGTISFFLISLLLFGTIPYLSTYAELPDHSKWNAADKNITYSDYSAYFDGYEGSFVLYDKKNEHWDIYNMELANTRTSPNSTYKIYDALFGLEEGVITPKDSLIRWDKTTYPYDAWNTDQTLPSAMRASVNWYFQAIDRQLGASVVQSYIRRIGYGNEAMSEDIDSYWMESTLKISPTEQVSLLTSMYDNAFDFAPENIKAVKDAIFLSSYSNGKLYGKTGTGQINGQNVNGWFIGYAEADSHTYFFATNIHAVSDATGSTASEITLKLLSDLGIISH